MTITEKNLHSGREWDRNIPDEQVFIFKKEIFEGVEFYIKIKKDSKVTYDRIKILSCHEAGF